MLQADVRSDIKEVLKQLDRVEKREVPKAASRALNRSAKKARTEATRTISREANVKPQRKIRDRIRVSKASWRRLVATVRALPRAFNLIEFVVPSKRHPRAFDRKQGVVAKAWGNKKTYPGTFIIRGQNSGKALVVKRTSGARYPVRSVYGPTVPGEFIRKYTQAALQKAVTTTFPKEFTRDLSRRLQRLNRR